MNDVLKSPSFEDVLIPGKADSRVLMHKLKVHGLASMWYSELRLVDSQQPSNGCLTSRVGEATARKRIWATPSQKLAPGKVVSNTSLLRECDAIFFHEQQTLIAVLSQLPHMHTHDALTLKCSLMHVHTHTLCPYL